MYGGKLAGVKFERSGTDADAILGKLSMAKILDECDGVYTISAEMFGKEVICG